MTIQSEQASVGTAAVSLATGGMNGVRVSLYNNSGTTAYIGGGTAVSSSTGHILAGSAALGIYVEQGEDLYAITASGTATVHVLRGGVQV